MKEIKKNRSAFDDRLLNQAVLKPILSEFPPKEPIPSGDGDFDPKASLAEILALQADLIRKHGKEISDAPDLKQATFDLYNRASNLDPKNVDYLFDKAKSRVELTGFNWLQADSWKDIDDWAARAVKYEPKNAKSQWLHGWAKLHESRAVRFDKPKATKAGEAREKSYEEAKLATLTASETALEETRNLAEKANVPDAVLAEIYLDLSQAALERQDFFGQVADEGIRQRIHAKANMDASLTKAAEYAQKALETGDKDPQAVSKTTRALMHAARGAARSNAWLSRRSIPRRTIKRRPRHLALLSSSTALSPRPASAEAARFMKKPSRSPRRKPTQRKPRRPTSVSPPPRSS